MRIRHLLAFGLLVAAVPASLCAQPKADASAEQQMAASGVWLEQANIAMATAAEGFGEISARMQALIAQGVTKEKAAAAAPELRRLIGEAKNNVQQSNAMLAALPPFPITEGVPFSPQQLVADARTQNGRFLTLLTDYEVFIDALAKGDAAAMGRILPKVMEGAFSLIGNQRLILRNRQATISPGESAHQSMGVAVELYRSMELVGRGAIGARIGGPAGSTKAAATLGPQLAEGAGNLRALTATGRKNLAAELAEFPKATAEVTSDADKRMLERVRRVTALEEDVFAIADRMATLLEANARISGAELAEQGMPKLYKSLTDMEAELVALSTRQSRILAEGVSR
jgi:hypothetical protein